MNSKLFNLKDYNTFRYSLKSILEILVKFFFVGSLFSFFFYRSIWFFAFLLLFTPFVIRIGREKNIKKQKEQLLLEFSDALISISINLKAGYALENAISESYKDICLLYGDKSFMAEEIMNIRRGLSINCTLEELLSDLANRSHLEDIQLLSEILGVAKRNGGNVTQVLRTSSEITKQKQHLSKEIKVMMSARTYELRIMEAMPFLIMIYIQVTSGEYFRVLYHNIRGIVFMTICAGMYVTAIFIAKRMMKIEI